MTPERRRQVEDLFHRAVSRAPEARAALLAGCDPEVRLEVESLLAQASGGELLTCLIAHVPELKTESMIVPGSELGPYRIEEAIGSGGMGTVYRAVDTRLKRRVAVKIGMERFSGRFAREAKAIAALNHPQICSLYDIGPNYLVMELVEGESLQARLKKGPLPTDQTMRYGAQIAGALAAAHAAGITHRDLKPGNIMLAKIGVKVLDFGLAKMASDQTLTAPFTVLGTPAYMAPEQRAGKEADPRADIYSLGVVLREMVTGSRDGDVSGPPHLVYIIENCLREDPEDRWQSALDIQKQLEWKPPTVASSTRSFRPWFVAAAAGLALLASNIAWYAVTRSTVEAEPSEFTISLDKQSGSLPVPSPDGRLLAFHGLDSNGRGAIWLRPVNAVSSHIVAGTEGAGRALFWSPRGDWIGFYADGAMKKIKAAGGVPFTIAEVTDVQDADWSPLGDTIFRTRNREALLRVRDSGGTPQPLTQLNAALHENSHRFPQFLSDGKRFLFVTRCSDRANNALYIGTLDSPKVTRVMAAQSRVFYSNGTVLYYRDGALVSQKLDLRGGTVNGDPAVVVPKIGYTAASIAANFRVSNDGRIIVSSATDSATARLIWFTRQGQETGVAGPPAAYSQPRLSPSGDRILFSAPDPKSGNRDIWFMDFARDITHRLTDNTANDWDAAFSPEGKQVVFGSDRVDGRTMFAFIKPSLDEDAAEVRFEGIASPTDWSKDGWIVGADHDLWARRLNEEKAVELVAKSAHAFSGRLSADSKWLAYSSEGSGRPEIYVQAFPGSPGVPPLKIQVSDRGGEYPVWNASRAELYYMAADDAIYAVDMSRLADSGKGTNGRTIDAPVRLFQACPGTRPLPSALSGSPFAPSFDTRDGQKFIVTCGVEAPGQYTVLMNWDQIQR